MISFKSPARPAAILDMITDKSINAVIVALFCGFLSTPAWSDPAMQNSEPSSAMTDSMRLTQPVPAAMKPGDDHPQTVHAVTTTLSTISSLDRTVGTMALIPLNHVFFAHDKAVLDQNARRILDDAALYIMGSGGIARVIIYGHANSIAGKDYNDRLSDKRANAVRDYLLEKDIPADLIWLHGWGENDPIDENWTREGGRRNRRVEIYLVEYSR